jgi:hypothetical protein
MRTKGRMRLFSALASMALAQKGEVHGALRLIRPGMVPEMLVTTRAPTRMVPMTISPSSGTDTSPVYSGRCDIVSIFRRYPHQYIMPRFVTGLMRDETKRLEGWR